MHSASVTGSHVGCRTTKPLREDTVINAAQHKHINLLFSADLTAMMNITLQSSVLRSTALYLFFLFLRQRHANDV